MSMFSRKSDKEDEEGDAEVPDEKNNNPEERPNAHAQVDMNVDGNHTHRNQFSGDLKTLSQAFTIKRVHNDNRTLEYYPHQEHAEESVFSRGEHSRVEDSSVPSMLAPRTMRNDPHYDKSLLPRRHMMFAEGADTSRFPKEELKEEVEEEKEIHSDRGRPDIFSTPRANPSQLERNFNNEEGSHHSDDQNSNSDDEPIEPEQEEPDREIDMIIDERITPRVLAESRVHRENSFQTRAEIQSSVENLSNTMPGIQISNEYQSHPNTINDRRFFNHLMGTGSIESSDYEENDPRLPPSIEAQVETIKQSFIQTLAQERQQIGETKKELRKYRTEFEKVNKQEWERIHMEKEICRENKKRVKKLLKDSEDIIDLDIGGTHHITTTRETL